MFQQYREFIKKIGRVKKETEEFPNFFIGMENRKLNTFEAFIQSILNRTKIPHIDNNILTNDDFFKHLTMFAEELAQIEGLSINLYIGGGVVRSLLGYTYKHLYQKESSQDTFGSLRQYQDAVALIEQMPDKSEEEEKLKSQLKLRSIFKNSEFHLARAAITEKKALVSPFVLGVGSDLDIYYEIKSLNRLQLTKEQINAGEKIRNSLIDYVNAVEKHFGLRDDNNPIKHSLLPIADVKEYHSQIERAVSQGGSLLDTLAFQLNPKKGQASCFRHPEQYPNILNDFLQGYYKYIAPEEGSASQKQSIRGLRSQLENPFLNIQDSRLLSQELLNILDGINNKTLSLDEDAKQQFFKMVRNANFELAHNRPYTASKDSPLNLALQISQAQPKNDNGIVLLPSFLQRMPFDSDKVIKKGKYFSKLKENFIDRLEFLEKYTEDGFVFHGTSLESGISALRCGFIESNHQQGNAFYGPGLYVASSYNHAKEYEDGMMLTLCISENILNIISSDTIKEFWDLLAEEAKEKNYINHQQNDIETGIFNLLKDRSQYAVDIIIATQSYSIIQNLNAIRVEENLETILKWLYMFVEQWLNIEEIDLLNVEYLSRNMSNLNDYVKYLDIFKALGVTLSENKNNNQKLKEKATVVLELICQMIGKETKLGIKETVIEKHFLEYGSILCRLGILPFDVSDKEKLSVILDWKHAHIEKWLNTKEIDSHNTEEMFFILNKYIEQHQRLNKLGDFLIENKIKKEDIAKKLIANSNSFGPYNALIMAMLHNYEIFELILGYVPDSVNYLVKDGPYQGYTPLALSIEKYMLKAAMKIISSPHNISVNNFIANGKGLTPLFMATRHCMFEVACKIIDRTFDNLNHVFICDGFLKGHTPLTVSIWFGQFEVAQKIIEKCPESLNVIINDLCVFVTPLFFAIIHNKIEIAELIIHMHPESIEYVISDSLRYNNYDAYKLAQAFGHSTLANLIFQVRANRNNCVIEKQRSVEMLGPESSVPNRLKPF